MNIIETRPWGSFEVLHENHTGPWEHCKIKKIEVLPGQRLSLQAHEKRSEHWYILSGTALVTKDGQNYTLYPNESVDIPPQCAHRVQALGVDSLVFIEIQVGSYLGEDDIVRWEDDYGRV